MARLEKRPGLYTLGIIYVGKTSRTARLVMQKAPVAQIGLRLYWKISALQLPPVDLKFPK